MSPDFRPLSVNLEVPHARSGHDGEVSLNDEILGHQRQCQMIYSMRNRRKHVHRDIYFGSLSLEGPTVLHCLDPRIFLALNTVETMYEHMNLTILATIGAVIFIFLLHGLRQSLNSALSKVPGPGLARFSRSWEFVQACRGDIHWTTIKLHEKHGLSLERLLDTS